MGAFLDVFAWYEEINFTTTPVKIAAVVAFIIYFLALFNFARTDSQSLSGKHVTLYIICMMIPVFILGYVVFNALKDPIYLIVMGTMIFVMICMLIRSIFPSYTDVYSVFITFFTSFTKLPFFSEEYSFVIGISLKILLAFIVIVGLSIVYNVFLNEGYRQQGKVGFLVYSLFFIPCLVSDFFSYIFQELKATPRVVFFLVLLEMILVLSYIFLPPLFNRLFLMPSGNYPDQNVNAPNIPKPKTPNRNMPGNQTNNPNNIVKYTKPNIVLSNPVSFYKTNNLGGIDLFNAHHRTDKNGTTHVTIPDYAISMWITTNTPVHSTESMMFRFGSDSVSQVGCPYIGCTPAGMWKIVVSNNPTEENKSTEVSVPMQRWNYVVLNYHEGQVDIFVNAELIDTKYNIYPIFSSGMNVKTGSDASDLQGAICNVTIYPGIMSSSFISRTYNILRLLNPPVNNLG